LPAVPGLPAHEVVDRDLVGVVAGAHRRDVDHGRFAHETPGLDEVDGVPALGEVPGSVEVRAAVLGGCEPVGRVVVPLGSRAAHARLEPEALLRRPGDRRRIEGVRQVEPGAGGEQAGGRGGIGGSCPRRCGCGGRHGAEAHHGHGGSGTRATGDRERRAHGYCG
jgi:hypothetical protein